MLKLACWHNKVIMVWMLGENGYLEERYSAPKVSPRLPKTGRQITALSDVCVASAANRESTVASSKHVRSLEFNTALCSASGKEEGQVTHHDE